MARTLTPQDCHVIMNSLVKEATGGNSTITSVNTSNFVSAGEQVLATGTENTLNALSIVLGKTLMAVRPYKAKLIILNAMNSGEYTNRMRKISFYSRGAQSVGGFNTQLNGANLKNGAENTSAGTLDNGANSATGSMWEQNAPVPLEVNFGGSSVWDDSTTVYEKQLKEAFTSEASFGTFVGGILTERANDIESQKEAFNRMTLLNHIAGVYDLSANMPGSAINLTEAFNTEYGTSYTSAQLRTTYLKEFLEFFVAKFKTISQYMTNRSELYHWTPARTGYTLLRHTPKERQKAILFNPLFIKAESMVLPEIFNDQYLKLDNYEPVDYWQNINEPSKISITPAIPNRSTPANGQIAGSAVSLDYVVGVLFDVDAIATDYQLEDAYTTPIEARKHYRNIWWSFKRNAINDFTENSVIFFMADSTEG